jgi:hypothetical protein
MAEVHFTSHLRNLVPDGPLSASGATVGEALTNLLVAQPDVDESGERLAMGSTTGALWTSADGGERWELVNAHLPPIYAVRFF